MIHLVIRETVSGSPRYHLSDTSSIDHLVIREFVSRSPWHHLAIKVAQRVLAVSRAKSHTEQPFPAFSAVSAAFSSQRVAYLETYDWYSLLPRASWLPFSLWDEKHKSFLLVWVEHKSLALALKFPQAASSTRGFRNAWRARCVPRRRGDMRSSSQSRPVINFYWPIVHSQFHDIKYYVFWTGYFCTPARSLNTPWWVITHVLPGTDRGTFVMIVETLVIWAIYTQGQLLLWSSLIVTGVVPGYK